MVRLHVGEVCQPLPPVRVGVVYVYVLQVFSLLATVVGVLPGYGVELPTQCYGTEVVARQGHRRGARKILPAQFRMIEVVDEVIVGIAGRPLVKTANVVDGAPQSGGSPTPAGLG